MHGRGLLAAGMAILGAVLALAAGSARADSIVYMKDHQVWIAQTDGGGARQFTLYDYSWSSPSEADDGTIVAAGGPGHGPYGDASSDLYRFSPDGNLLNGPIPTPGTYYTLNCPTQKPWPVRVSPDGSKIAYGTLICSTREDTAVWTPSTATGLDWPDANHGLGTQDYYEPLWVDNTHFLVSHAGEPITSSSARWYLHDITGDGHSEPGWLEPSMDATGAQAALARTGTRFAVFTDDAADWTDGAPRSVSVWLYDAPDLATAMSGWTKRCEVPLDPATMHDPFHLSPSFSPDGSKLLWADDRGVEVASVANLADCASFVPHLLLPGASQPFYAKGNLHAAAANPAQPGAPAGGGGGAGGGGAGGGGTGGGGTPGQTITPPPPPCSSLLLHCVTPPPPRTLKAAFTVAGKRLRVRRAITFDARKSTIGKAPITSYAWTFGDGHHGKGRRITHRYRKAGRYTVTLTVRDRSGAKATIRHRIKVLKR